MLDKPKLFERQSTVFKLAIKEPFHSEVVYKA
jgi:hypothetical protein